MPAAERSFTIAHISDIHCGGPHFMPSLMDRAIGEINDLQPDLIICTGDLTTFGFKQEFAQAKSYLDRLECESLVTRKNRKLRKLRERYPDVKVKLFYKRDIQRLADRYKLDLAS